MLEIKPLDDKRVDEVLKILELDICDCLYLYVDLYKYRLTNENINFYIFTENDKICGVMMKYYTGLQTYANSNYEEVAKGITEFVLENKDLTVVAGKKELLDLLKINDDEKWLYKETYIGERFKCDHLILDEYKIEAGTKNDLDELVNFYVNDEFYENAYPDKTVLYKQIEDRLESGFGRIFVIRDQGKIIAATQIMADTPKIALSGFGLVDKQYRGKGIAEYIIESVTDLIKDEGKRFFGIWEVKKGIEKYMKLGTKLVAIGGKYILKKN